MGSESRPRVSVCMCAYNQEDYIREAIEGVLYQSYPSELVIGEDHSSDHTLDICREYQAHHPREVKVHPRERNLGLAGNLARTWRECSGEYIAMLEADDLWISPLKLETQVRFMEDHPEYSMCFTLTSIKSDHPNRHDRWPYRENTKATLLTGDILRHNLIANCSVMYRRIPDVFGTYPWLLDLPYCDIALHCLHSIRGPIAYIPEPMAMYRLHDSSMFESKPFMQRIAYSAVVYSQLVRHLPEPYSQQAAQSLMIMLLGLHQWRGAWETFWKLPAMYRLTWPSIPAEQAYHMWAIR